jgi:hypothetical protein
LDVDDDPGFAAAAVAAGRLHRALTGEQHLAGLVHAAATST